MSETMTVKMLVDKAKSMEENAAELDQLNAIMQSDVEIHDRTIKLLEEKFGKKRDPVYILNGAANRIREYAKMLDHIMSDTQLQWPPSVGPGNKT